MMLRRETSNRPPSSQGTESGMRLFHPQKECQNFMIHEPITIKKEGTVADALNLMKEYKIGGIPVVDESRGNSPQQQPSAVVLSSVKP